MLILTLLGIVALLIAFIIYKEYQNEKKYKEQKRRYQEKRDKKLTPKVTKRIPPKPANVPPKSSLKKEKEEKEIQQATKVAVSTEKTGKKPPKKTQPDHTKTANIKKEPDTLKSKTVISKTLQPPQKEPISLLKTAKFQTEPPVSKTVEIHSSSKELPKNEYPLFNYNRILEMGLSDEEALEFIQELIPQIEEQVPLIQAAMDKPDLQQMERLTHSIKGSSTTIGTGGISDLLTDYNTYLKKGDKREILETYQKDLEYYLKVLKEQYPSKEKR